MRARRKLQLGLLLVLAACSSFSGPLAAQARAQQEPTETEEPAFSGLDQSINESLAEEAGAPSRDPFINTEAMGELWNLLLLAGGGICGFIIGRYWDQIWGRRDKSRES